MNRELFGSSTFMHSCTLRPLRAPVVFRQRRSALKTLAARRDSKQEEEEKPQNLGLFGGLTSRIGAGSKQKAEPGTEKVGRKQRAPAAPKPERKQKAEPASGTQKIKNQPKGNVLGLFGGRRDANTVFVAGGSGRLGARIVRELLNRGFKVRVGVRDQAQGDSLLKTAINYGLVTAEAGRKAQIVEFDLLDEATIGPAIGNASKVVSAIGAAEAQPFDVGAPKRIDGDAAIRLVNVAAQAGVEQFTMVTALGTGKFGWPASLLNLFWGILVWKKKAEEALQASGMQYTIVRPGGMEVPRDDHKLTHNVILGQRDSTFGGTVSRLQVAELIGAALSEPSLAANKVLEVWSETEAPAADYESLLRAQPNERASDEENATAAQAVSAVEPGKGLKRQRTQKYAPPRTPGQTAAPTLPKARPGPPTPKPQAAAATPAAPPKPKNPAEVRREEERQQESDRQQQWQADQEAQRAANQIPSQQPKPRDLEAEAQEQKARAAKNEEYARNRMATEARVQAEAEQERQSARDKENARREAEKQKRLQAADKDSNAKKQAEQQLLAQNKVTKVITPPGTNQLSSAEQDLGSAQPSKKLPGAEQGKGEKKPSAPKPAPAAASKPPSSAGASPEQAKKNAEEAARWISNWRSNGAGSNGAASNGSSNGASASKTTSAASSNASSNGSSPSSKGSAQAVKGKAGS